MFPIYGTKGVADAANTPALRSQSLTWTDAQGNLWLLGGNGNPADKPYDLWKFSVATGKWAWMAGPSTTVCTSFPCTGEVNYGTLGVPDPSLYPSSRQEPVSFTGNDGSLWLFGGLGKDSRGTAGRLNDLWRFDTTLNAWAWMGGANTLTCGSTWVTNNCGVSAVYGTKGVAAKSNTPGGMVGPAGWSTPDGKLWLYGGFGVDGQGKPGALDDLWSYDIATGMWTWVSGSGTWSTTPTPPAAYGTKGVPSPTNSPGFREDSTTWTDNAGHLWLFSGLSMPNDLWEYDPKSNQWTWQSGSTDPTCDVYHSCATRGIYGTEGTPDSANTPGVRSGPATWTALDGTLWMYGGLGADSAGEIGHDGQSHTYLNDLWQFDPATRRWTWINGASQQNCTDIMINQNSFAGTWCWTPSVPGVQGTPAPPNTPGSRTQMLGWRDLAGNLRLYGGVYFEGDPVLKGMFGAMEDTWSFHPTSAFDRVTSTPSFSIPAGIYSAAQSVTISDSDSGAAIYYTTDGSTPTQSSQLYTGPVQLSHNTALKAIAVANGSAPSAAAQSNYVFNWSFSLVMAAGSPATNNIPVGGSGTFTLAAIPVLGTNFPSAVFFSISGLPQGATATFNPTQIGAGSARSTVSVAIQTTAARAMQSTSPASLLLCFAGLPFLLIAARRRAGSSSSALRMLLCACAVAPLFGLLFACGGGGASGSSSNPGGSSGVTPAGTYPLVITASSGGTAASITVTAQVQ